MLKHRLTRRLSTLFMLVAVLAAVSVERKAVATTASHQAASSAATGTYCILAEDESGNCAILCCDNDGCSVTPC
jgi:hypothetical protein